MSNQSESCVLRPIAHIRSPFSQKFGIPRQSGLVPAVRASVVFLPEFRNPDALRGLEEFSHIWLLWEFSASIREGWSPMVRPPRLGGNVRKGVFATRAPFRPNPIGLSAVRLEAVRQDARLGPVLELSGADLLDGTPIFDIKPYLPYVDAIPAASGGFAPAAPAPLEVDCPPALLSQVPEAAREALLGVLSLDPRPQYQSDPKRLYAMDFSDLTVRFTVDGHVLTVRAVEKRGQNAQL